MCKQSAPHFRQITTPTLHHSIFTGRVLFLTPNQQCQSTEGLSTEGFSAYRLFCSYLAEFKCRDTVELGFTRTD